MKTPTYRLHYPKVIRSIVENCPSLTVCVDLLLYNMYSGHSNLEFEYPVEFET
jgi:hypothetical protein